MYLKPTSKCYLLIDLCYIFTLVISQYLLHICVLLLFILWRLNKIQSINIQRETVESQIVSDIAQFKDLPVDIDIA